MLDITINEDNNRIMMTYDEVARGIKLLDTESKDEVILNRFEVRDVVKYILNQSIKRVKDLDSESGEAYEKAVSVTIKGM